VEEALRIYLDACALNRLTDDQEQARIREEAHAVEQIFGLIFLGDIEWVASRTLELELKRNPDAGKRADALELLSHAASVGFPSALVLDRGRLLARAGYGAFDALHLAHGEDLHVDVLLTTDDRFLRQARRGLGTPTVRVANPLNWLEEVRGWLRQRP
jgi:predicted nucleic acid-binding protein